MKHSVSPLVAQLSVQVTGTISGGKERLGNHPVTRSFCSLLAPIPSTQVPAKIDAPLNNQTQGPFTHIIILCLSYPGMKFPNGANMEIHGTRNDLSLILTHFRLLDEGNSVDFTILNDFEHDHTDSNGWATTVPKADTTKKGIEYAIRSIMQRTTPGSRVLFYAGGHGRNSQAIIANNQAIIAGDGQRISGTELRSWLSATPHSSVPVTAVFDCCESGGSLRLPYNFEKTENGVESQKSYRKRSSNPILQISATRRDQAAMSCEFSGGYYGRLTWCLLRYLSKNPSNTTIGDIVDFMNARFEPSGSQMPQISCSQKLVEEFPFF